MSTLLRRIYRKIKSLKSLLIKERPKYIENSSLIGQNVKIFNPDNLIMDSHTNISANSVIMNTRAKFIMKKNSGAAIELLVVTGNHMSLPGRLSRTIKDKDKDAIENPKQFDRDVIVEEDVWLGARVTLLMGAHIGRGAIVGAGSVVRTAVPPYSVVIGNPAKVVGFRFSLEDIIKHENALYPKEERLSPKVLESNYEKYYTKRIKDITKFIKV